MLAGKTLLNAIKIPFTRVVILLKLCSFNICIIQCSYAIILLITVFTYNYHIEKAVNYMRHSSKTVYEDTLFSVYRMQNCSH